jgi:hypothetical protein
MGCCHSLWSGGSERAPKLHRSAPIQSVPQRASRRLDFVDNQGDGRTVEDTPLLVQPPQVGSTEGTPVVEGPLDEEILERMLAEVDGFTI